MTQGAAQRQARREAEARGRRAETIAALAYRLRGFAIVARRFRSRAGEVDLIARRGRLLVFAEVKARRSHDAAVFSVDPRTRRRVSGAAQAFIASAPHHAGADLRYDIVSVAGWSARILVDAWRDGE